MNKLLVIYIFLCTNIFLFGQNTNEIQDVPVTDDGLPLRIPTIQYGTATLKGYITGDDQKKEQQGKISAFNPISGEKKDIAVKIDTNGYFSAQIPLISTTQLIADFPFSKEIFILSPDEEASINIDLQKKKANKHDKGNSYDFVPFIQFSGINANLNNQIHIARIYDYLERELSTNRIMADVSLMTNTAQYENYINNKYNIIKEELSRKGLTGKVYEFTLLEAELKCVELLLKGNFIFRELASKKYTNLTKHTESDPVFNLDYYSFLRKSHINNPMSLYSKSYADILNTCQYIGYTMDKYKVRYRTRPLTGEMIQKLIDSGKLTAEEKKYAESIKNDFFDNWDKEKISTYKKHFLEYANRLIATNKLTGKSLLYVKYMQELSQDEKSTVRSINDIAINIPIQIIEDKIFTNKYLQDLNDSIFTKDDFASTHSETDFANLVGKYKNEIDFMQEEEYRNGQKKILSDILGTDKGLLFDMMTLNAYGKKIKRMIPLSECEFEDITAMRNPEYSKYLTIKNDKLIDQNSQNSTKYHVNQAPSLNDDLILSEITNIFPEKTIVVTFWTTWNPGSLHAINLLESLKKRYPENEIIFIYLTDESSPLKTWEGNIQYIGGEHFRLKNKQLTYLMESLNMDKMPSFLIMDKKRKQVYLEDKYYQKEIADTLDKLIRSKR